MSGRLVTLRTKPIEDPGEWCCRIDTGTKCPHWFIVTGRCAIGHRSPVDSYRRPQSCIDDQEEVKP